RSRPTMAPTKALMRTRRANCPKFGRRPRRMGRRSRTAGWVPGPGGGEITGWAPRHPPGAPVPDAPRRRPSSPPPVATERRLHLARLRQGARGEGGHELVLGGTRQKGIEALLERERGHRLAAHSGAARRPGEVGRVDLGVLGKREELLEAPV